jgi:hypothetical protein
VSTAVLRVAGGELVVPPGWEVASDVGEPLLLLLTATEAAPASTDDVTVVASVALTCERVEDPGAGIRPHLDALQRALTDHHLVDLVPWEVAGVPGGARVLCLHTTGGEGLATEHWLTGRSGDRRWVLSATCLATRYDEFADDFAALAASWRLDDAEGA